MLEETLWDEALVDNSKLDVPPEPAAGKMPVELDLEKDPLPEFSSVSNEASSSFKELGKTS